MQINPPAMLSTLTQASERYEAALLTNDLAILDHYFWQDARVERIGPEGEQLGAEAARRARAVWPLADLPRERLARRILVFSADALGDGANGLVNIVFKRSRDGRIGRQTQSWMHIDGAWRIVAAHVSYRETTPL